MDYGSGIYSSARKSWLLPLDRVFQLGLRIALGAYPTTNVSSLYAEAGVLPMQHRREQMTLSYIETVQSKSRHFLKEEYFGEGAIRPEYEWLTTRTRPLPVRAREIKSRIRADEDEILEWSIPETPPWKRPGVRMSTRLTSLPRETTLPEVYRQGLLETLARYPGRRVFYTDGSKTETGVGCAMHSSQETRSWSMSPRAGVYTAELKAIEKTLAYCLEEEFAESIVVCSDSLSALQAIKDKFSDDPIISRIYDHVSSLHSSGRHVVLIWVPGHVGIAGNEAADQAAKHASAARRVEDGSIRLDDAKTASVNAVWRHWRAEWDRSFTQLRRIKMNPREKITALSKSRRDSVVITRLRLGHTQLTHGHLLTNERAPRCRHCDRATLTVSHIFEECDSLAELRAACGAPANVAVALAEDSHRESVLSFLHRAGFYNLI